MKFSIARLALVAALVLAAIVTLFPVYWMVISSLKPTEEIFRIPPTWIPETFTLRHYQDLFSRFQFYELTRNSLVITLSVVVINVVIGSMAAYGFSRYSFPGSRALLVFILLARMLTPAAFVVPLYTMMKFLGLLDNVLSIIIGVSIMNLPFVVWVMKAFFDGVPRELEEAAALDGLSSFGIFWRIVVPISTPAVTTVALFSFIAAWTDFLFGITFSTTARSMPLTVGIANMQTGYEIYWGPMMAAGTYLALPTFVLALVFRRYLIRGLVMVQKG